MAEAGGIEPRSQSRRRRGQWPVPLRRWLVAAVPAAAVLVLVGSAVVRSSGPRRLPCAPVDEALRLGRGAECATTYRHDADGDGTEDRVVAYHRRRASTSYELRLRFIPAQGAPSDVKVKEVDDPDEPMFDAVVDLNGDRQAEVLLVEELGANTHLLALYTIDRGRLVPVIDRSHSNDGVPFDISVGGALSHGNSYGCEDVNGDAKAELVVTSFSIDLDRPETRHWERDDYRWASNRAVELVRSRSGVERTDRPERGVLDVRSQCGVGAVTPAATLLPDPATTPIDAAAGVLREWRAGDRHRTAAFTGGESGFAEDVVERLFSSGLDPSKASVERCNHFRSGDGGDLRRPPGEGLVECIVRFADAPPDAPAMILQVEKTPSGPWYAVVTVILPADQDFEGGL